MQHQNVKTFSFTEWTQKHLVDFVNDRNRFSREMFGTKEKLQQARRQRYADLYSSAHHRASSDSRNNKPVTDATDSVAFCLKDKLSSMWLSIEACGRSCKDAAVTAMEELTSGNSQQKLQPTSSWSSSKPKSLGPSTENLNTIQRPVSETALNSRNIIRPNFNLTKTKEVSTKKMHMVNSEDLSVLLKNNLSSTESFRKKKQQSVRSGDIKISGTRLISCSSRHADMNLSSGSLGDDSPSAISKRTTRNQDMNFDEYFYGGTIIKREVPESFDKRTDKRRHVSGVSENMSLDSCDSTRRDYGLANSSDFSDDVCLTPFEALPVETTRETSYWIGMSLGKNSKDGSLVLDVRQTGSLPEIVQAKNFSKLSLSLTISGKKYTKKFNITLMKSKRDNKFVSHALKLKGFREKTRLSVQCKLIVNYSMIKKSLVEEWKMLPLVSSSDFSQYEWKRFRGANDQ